MTQSGHSLTSTSECDEELTYLSGTQKSTDAVVMLRSDFRIIKPTLTAGAVPKRPPLRNQNEVLDDIDPERSRHDEVVCPLMEHNAISIAYIENSR